MTEEKRLAEVRQEIRKEARRVDRKRWKSFVAIFASVFATVGVNIAFTTIYQQEQNQNWCDLFTFMDEQNQLNHSTDPIQQEWTVKIHTQREKLHCK